MTSKVRNLHAELKAKTWTTLEHYTYEFEVKPGEWKEHLREAYNRGNGATVLLYNPEKQTVLLTKQFRLPTYINGNTDGMMIEACAGKLAPGEDPKEGMIREIEEETGHRVTDLKKVMEVYMSPGSVTELMYFFTAPFSEKTKVAKGGGLEEEQEYIEVVEVPFEKAMKMIETREIKDAKTIMLLQYLKINPAF